MASKWDERKSAWDNGATGVISFSQPGDDCLGWVSYWLRCRLKGQEFFAKSTRFSLVHVTHAGVDVTRATGTDSAKRKSEGLENSGDVKGYLGKNTKSG